MNVLVLNAGSSSIKAAMHGASAAGEIAANPAWSGELRWTKVPARGVLVWTAGARSGTAQVDVDEHGSAARAMLAAAVQSGVATPDIVGHRVVHGLNESRCALIDTRIRATIEAAADLAPLHNRAALAGIDAVQARWPGLPQAADFDTAFHTTLAPAVAAYAVPYDWYAVRGWRRYGFHGISHRYCAQRTAELLAVEPRDVRLVSAHLGNGCSLAAIANGQSVDTTMGFTPLEGLMMGSRSGSIDPGLLLYIIGHEGMSAADLDRILNTESGLAGVSGVSEDIRDVIAAADGGAQRARLALDMYVHRVSAGIAAMAASLGGLDALAFTGGVGKHSAYVRREVAHRLAFLGIGLRDDVDADGPDREIGAAGARVRVVVVAAREEYAIARDVARLAPAAIR